MRVRHCRWQQLTGGFPFTHCQKVCPIINIFHWKFSNHKRMVKDSDPDAWAWSLVTKSGGWWTTVYICSHPITFYPQVNGLPFFLCEHGGNRMSPDFKWSLHHWNIFLSANWNKSLSWTCAQLDDTLKKYIKRGSRLHRLFHRLFLYGVSTGQTDSLGWNHPFWTILPFLFLALF